MDCCIGRFGLLCDGLVDRWVPFDALYLDEIITYHFTIMICEGANDVANGVRRNPFELAQGNYGGCFG